MNIKLGNKLLDYSSVHIVLEAGPTHNGLNSAKKLVDIAVSAGADSIKFQMLYPERLMAKNHNVPFSYKILKKIDEQEIFEEKQEQLFDILNRRVLKKEEWIELKKYCDEKQIHFFSTAFYKEEVDFLVDDLKVDSIKIASADIDQLDFIKYCAKKNINIQLDTGSSDLHEIEKAIIAIEEEGNSNIIIHHCPSGYPARVESIHLNMIKTLKEMFPNYLIAFSDHTEGWEMDIAAITMGAGMVEKTITEDRFFVSCEHSFSLEAEAAIKFIKSIRQLEIALGDKRRTIPKDVKNSRKNSRRSAYLIRNHLKGDVLTSESFEFKRPGIGITPEQMSFFIGKKLNKDKLIDQIIEPNDFTDN